MREILFRGKRIGNKEWIQGSTYLNDPDLEKICIGGYDYYTTEDGWQREEYCCEVDPETVCQYTGLNDENGRRIFEGDIFPYHFNNKIVGVVRFGRYRNPFNDDEHGGHVGFYVDWGKRKEKIRADLAYWIKLSAVKGNIFDNPELLEADHAAGD